LQQAANLRQRAVVILPHAIAALLAGYPFGRGEWQQMILHTPEICDGTHSYHGKHAICTGVYPTGTITFSMFPGLSAGGGAGVWKVAAFEQSKGKRAAQDDGGPLPPLESRFATRGPVLIWAYIQGGGSFAVPDPEMRGRLSRCHGFGRMRNLRLPDPWQGKETGNGQRKHGTKRKAAFVTVRVLKPLGAREAIIGKKQTVTRATSW
jgi:hypothetical protein